MLVNICTDQSVLNVLDITPQPLLPSTTFRLGPLWSLGQLFKENPREMTFYRLISGTLSICTTGDRLTTKTGRRTAPRITEDPSTPLFEHVLSTRRPC